MISIFGRLCRLFSAVVTAIFGRCDGDFRSLWRRFSAVVTVFWPLWHSFSSFGGYFCFVDNAYSNVASCYWVIGSCYSVIGSCYLVNDSFSGYKTISTETKGHNYDTGLSEFRESVHGCGEILQFSAINWKFFPCRYGTWFRPVWLFSRFDIVFWPYMA